MLPNDPPGEGGEPKGRAATTFEGMLRRGGPPIRALPVSTTSSIKASRKGGAFLFRTEWGQPTDPVPYSTQSNGHDHPDGGWPGGGTERRTLDENCLSFQEKTTIEPLANKFYEHWNNHRLHEHLVSLQQDGGRRLFQSGITAVDQSDRVRVVVPHGATVKPSPAACEVGKRDTKTWVSMMCNASFTAPAVVTVKLFASRAADSVMPSSSTMRIFSFSAADSCVAIIEKSGRVWIQC